jgi:hypothetical protein
MKTLFLGDSHTCGYQSDAISVSSNCSSWNDNNYAEFYAKENNKQSLVYAMPGACNRLYPDWITTMLSKHPDIDEIFVLLTSWNRFIISSNDSLSDEVLPVDHFVHHHGSKHNLVEFYYDVVIKDNRLQLLNKPTVEDFENKVSLNFSEHNGLITPDIRKNNFMEVKLYFDLNTHLEQRDFFKDILIMDTICNNHNCKMYVFQMTDRISFPTNLNFYTELKATKYSPISVEKFFKKRFINHKKFYISDNEHYDEEYHKLIATMFIPWLKSI